MEKTLIVITAMILVAGLEGIAMANGYNGAALTSSVAVIAGLGGFGVGRKKLPGQGKSPPEK